ncbi:MAG: DUF6194 family protein [Neoaquamicrobium sediminum]|uniref:DUF6194 family protein n=1 Tax=Neoaquamicrobium sediminum TaxID=1849104 RepID=UPI0040368821
MSMLIADIRNFLETALPSVTVDDSTADLFFFTGEERKIPFATIVTRDTPFDSASNLTRGDLFRLNLVTDKETFERLFGIRTSNALDDADFDYQALDRLFPHPLYGKMRWISVINPETVWENCQELLVKARQIRELRPNSW